MKDSPKMKEVVEQLAQTHDVDLTQSGACFRLDIPHFDCLVVERINSEKISVAHLYEVQDQSIPEPAIKEALLTDEPILLADRPAGFYAIRLRVKLRNGETFQPCDIVVKYQP